MAERNLKMIDYDLISVINHGIAVSNLAYQVGEVMGLPKDQCYELALAGVLHDIGKTAAFQICVRQREPSGSRGDQICPPAPSAGMRGPCEPGIFQFLCWRVSIIIMKIMMEAVIPRIFREMRSLWEAGS